MPEEPNRFLVIISSTELKTTTYDFLGTCHLEKFYETTCELCGCPLNRGYAHIIFMLKLADLLPFDFKLKCCICKAGAYR